MKKYFFLLFLLSASFFSLAQPGKKPAPKEKPPTQKEMEDMMKEAQKAVDEMSPEDKKMMDSMGIKMPSLKNVPKVSDKQLAQAWETENLIVPKRDNDRIAAILKTPLSSGSVAAFVTDVHNKTLQLLWPESKTLAEKIYSQLKSSGKSSDAIGNTATGLWIMGRLQPALYIMGKICVEDAANNDNLANYASMISMCGIQQSAIPMLNYLNTKYPGNSTILNNLGQAWFGLGDMDKSTKYLDSTIRIYANHPQANLTKSFIAEEKGNKEEAVSLVKKSMLHAYSKDKEDRLRKLGYKMNSDDVKLPPKTKVDPLNLGGSAPPSFPKSVDECIALEPVWAGYREQLDRKLNMLGKQYKDAMKVAADMQQKRTEADFAMVKASLNAGSPQGMLTAMPLHAAAASLKANQVTEEYGRKLEAWSKKMTAFLSGRAVQLKKNYEASMELLRKQDLEQTGEGLPNVDFCPKYKATCDQYLSGYNSELENLYKEYLSFEKPYLNDLAYWLMYVQWPEMFEATKLQTQMTWLGVLEGKEPVGFESITTYKCVKPTPGAAGKLSEFDDVACKYHSELKLGLGSIKSDCSRMTTELDAGIIKLGLKQNMDKETFADQFMTCNVEVGAQIGKTVKTGPLTVGVSAGGRIGMEIDRNGVSDVYTVGGVSAAAGVGDVSIDAGIEGKVSLISGSGSIYGTGIFQK
ncbi:tetratricopeptide repeat protein [Ferruginibacter sp. SUN106]|uniref:tetratricopeptide repeat protein n=1 Tax=Ferruginibacter sp. SUN106 TaxID=2978348 RepID=UPI003D35EA2A